MTAMYRILAHDIFVRRGKFRRGSEGGVCRASGVRRRLESDGSYRRRLEKPMAINDDDITTEGAGGGEGTADGGANPGGHDGGADGSA
jgi:hypothetical protein